MDERRIWPVELDQEVKSLIEPGSVHTNFSISPLDNSSMAFLVFNIGRGQGSPWQSSSLFGCLLICPTQFNKYRKFTDGIAIY